MYELSRTAIPINVDGKLDDSVWAKAPRFSDFRLNLDGAPGPYETEARALYDDTFLYFSFRCRDDNIWASFKTRDQHLWEEEVVEVFLQADPNRDFLYRVGGKPPWDNARYLPVGCAQAPAL